MQAKEIEKIEVSASSAFGRTLHAGMWIQLEDLPSPYAHNQALLLCQKSEDSWVSWIPDHGEYILEF